MAVYSADEIRAALDNEHIVCHPLDPANVRGSSIDVTLGEWFYRCDVKQPGGLYNPFSKDDVFRYFRGPMQAKHYRSVFRKIAPNRDVNYQWSEGLIPPWPEPDVGLEGIPDDHPVIILRPRERILSHTHEFIGIHAPGTTEMRARSSWGRNGVAVCLCAGWGDPGYINRWTMEIQNANDEAVVLPLGERIAQIIFHRTDVAVDIATMLREAVAVSASDPDKHLDYIFREHILRLADCIPQPDYEAYGDQPSYDGGSKYQQGTDLASIVANWKPETLIPRSYKDKRKMPIRVDLTSGEWQPLRST